MLLTFLQTKNMFEAIVAQSRKNEKRKKHCIDLLFKMTAVKKVKLSKTVKTKL